MNTRRFRIAAIAVFLLVLQQALMTKFSVIGVHLDLLLLFALCVGISGGADRGALAGFAAGLAADVFLTSPLGLSALAYAAAGYLVGRLADDASELVWVTGSLAALGSICALTIFLFLGSAGADVHVGFGRGTTLMFVISFTNAVFAPLVVPLLRKAWVSRREVAW